jgi:iron(III) transport system permease protein
MGWLIAYSLSDKQGAATLGNFVTLFTDPSFVDPLITTLIIAVSVSAICCIVAAPLGWLVARTDMPIRRTVRTLVMASLVTPPFVGAIAWEMLAAPNSGLLNQLWRSLTGMPPDEALFDIYSLTGLIFVIACYTFPYVFILVANALDRMPGELEDASSMLGAKTWQTARRITVPLALPTLLAGALVAFLQALNLFGSPAILAIPAGFHTLTTRIWSLFQFPPKPELAAAASAAAHDPVAARPGAGAGPTRLCRAGRQVRRAAPGAAGRLAASGGGAGAAGARHAAVPALRGAVQLGLLARRLAPGHARYRHAA